MELAENLDIPEIPDHEKDMLKEQLFLELNAPKQTIPQESLTSFNKCECGHTLTEVSNFCSACGKQLGDVVTCADRNTYTNKQDYSFPSIEDVLEKREADLAPVDSIPEDVRKAVMEKCDLSVIDNMLDVF